MTELERESKRFAGNVGKCWHEVDTYTHKCSCGKQLKSTRSSASLHTSQSNPTYTIELIRSELGDKWDGFRWWLWEGHRPYGCSSDFDKVADILTTPLLLLQAANAYMEEK